MNTHQVSILDRNTISITGVNKIENFDKEEFLIETIMGFINIKGENLEVIKLDTIEGNVSIKGKLNSMIYIESNRKDKKDSFMTRLFK